jgi:hypothetical protein
MRASPPTTKQRLGKNLKVEHQLVHVRNRYEKWTQASNVVRDCSRQRRRNLARSVNRNTAS